MKLRTSIVVGMVVLMCVIRKPAGAALLGTAFTYQGNLIQNGTPVTNTADFQFTLWDALNFGIQVAGPMAVNNVSVANGQFTASIDFGSVVFNGDARWLQIAVRSPAGSGTFTTLTPRQPLMAVPYALQTRGLFVDASRNVGIGTTAPAKKLTVAGSMEVGIAASDYQHLRIGGGNSSGFLYGSFPHFGDGIHLGYNYYANASGVNQIPGPGGGTSRVSMGYGYVALATQAAGQGEPVNRFVVDGAVRSYGDHLFANTSAVNVGAINPDPPPGSSTFPAGTPTMRAGAISMYGPAGRTRFGVWSRDTNFGGTWFPNQAHLFMDAADGNRVISIYCTGEGGAGGSAGNIVCTNFLATGSKNFLVPNPDNPKEDITYACLEGPECGMYIRGTAKLIDGRATVRLPETFSSLASQEGLTVLMMPLSGASLGLACVNRTIHGFDVVELMNGEGNYEFDWEVKAIRRGTRDYKVVHPWTEHASGEGSESELWERRMADIERRNARFAQEDAELGPRPEARPSPLVVAD